MTVFPMLDVYFQRVWFSGRVQGVGFRYATLQVAKEFDVSGGVRNLADGRVELAVEGAEGEIRAMVAAVEERMHGYIRKVERGAVSRRPAEFQGFVIR